MGCDDHPEGKNRAAAFEASAQRPSKRVGPTRHASHRMVDPRVLGGAVALNRGARSKLCAARQATRPHDGNGYCTAGITLHHRNHTSLPLSDEQWLRALGARSTRA